MANVTRWTPGRMSPWDRDLFDEMDRMLSEPFFGRRGDSERGGNWGLPLDVSEREDRYVVRASIPGINPDDIDLSISDNVLTIRGNVGHSADDERENYVLRERRMGSFTRSVTFPMAINSEAAEATCEHGVLTIQLPKAETARPRRISIGGGGTGRQTIEGQSMGAGAGMSGGMTNIDVNQGSGYMDTGERGMHASAGGGVRTERGAVGDSHGWPEGQADTNMPHTERNREGQGWTEGMSDTNREERAPQSGGWTEGQSQTWDEKTPHSEGWTEGKEETQRGS